MYGVNRKYYAKVGITTIEDAASSGCAFWFCEFLGQLLALGVVSSTIYYAYTSEFFKQWYYTYVAIISLLSIIVKSIAQHYAW